MPSHRWPPDAAFPRLVFEPHPSCPLCHGRVRICDHRHRDLQIFGGRLHLVCKLAHCQAPRCPMRGRTISPEAELFIAPPRWTIGWEPFAWIGHRRVAQDWRVGQIRQELFESHHVDLSDDSIERYIGRYQTMLAAREQDPDTLTQAYRTAPGVILSIDGLQPEKGHETLYVVRELTQRRIWFAAPLLSSAAPEVARLLAQAQEWAQRVGQPVLAWISDKQDAFVSGIARLFPGVPHRYCANHFLRDAAKPVLERDSHAKVKMRRKVRGLRAIERSVLAKSAPLPEEPQAAEPVPTPSPPTSAAVPEEPPAVEPVPPPLASAARPSPAPTPAQAPSVVLDYCAAVRGILNDDQGGPLHPPGVRMADALTEVRASLHRVLGANKLGAEHRSLERLARCIDRGLTLVEADLVVVRDHAHLLADIDTCLDSGTGPSDARQARFDALAADLQRSPDPIRLHMGRVMSSFAPGLFAGADLPNLPLDNLDLERAFKHPKRHQRRIHGRAHAGSRLVQEGPTLLLALDAHQRHPHVFSVSDLLPYRNARPPRCQREAVQRRAVMRKARSSKNRATLLAQLERRYFESG